MKKKIIIVVNSVVWVIGGILGIFVPCVANANSCIVSGGTERYPVASVWGEPLNLDAPGKMFYAMDVFDSVRQTEFWFAVDKFNSFPRSGCLRVVIR